MRCGSDFDLKTDQLGKLGSEGMEESKRRSVMRVSPQNGRDGAALTTGRSCCGSGPLVF